MDYYAIVGMVVGALILVGGFYYTVKRNTQDEAEQLQALNTNIIKLNTNFENMLESDKNRDARISNHGKEIDELKNNQKVAYEKLTTAEKLLDRHENRISRNEERITRLENRE